jgi:thiol-disulfide isomerase/thioredoxin
MNFKISFKTFLFSGLLFLTFSAVKGQSNHINWISFDQLSKKMAGNPKPILIHTYTPWCGYCKKMAATTFIDPEVISFINANFYAVEMNGEEPATIILGGRTYKYNYDYSKRRNGAHQLLIDLLKDNILYPSDIILSTDYKVKKVKRGMSVSETYLDFLKTYINALI